MASSAENVASSALEPAMIGQESNSDALGRMSLLVCLLGAIATAILIMAKHPSAGQIKYGIAAPFIGCQIIAFVLGVFSRSSLLGKLGMMLSLLAFCLFVTKIHNTPSAAPIAHAAKHHAAAK